MYELLAEPIRKFIRDKRWEALTPIQNAAIQHIMRSKKHIILAAHTASGKTEAAFLPILSKVNFNEKGVKVLYISPLIALINDQFERVDELCAYLGVPVTKWHGEASKSLKDKLVKDPAGVVLITPESLEAMLDNAPMKADTLFKFLDFVVIDEIHAFSGTDRGMQLQSILSRLRQLTKHPFRVVGLSATLGEFTAAKKMTGQPENTLVLRDKNKKEMDAAFRYYPNKNADLPPELIEDLYQRTKDRKTLIFPNSRGRAEEIAVRLQKMAERLNGHPYYFSHHSSVDKELREYIEHFAKENKRFPFAIACTSTLELGIDIGTVDLVIQVDAAHSVSSLVQRTGRSGRRDGELSHLICYATDHWSLLQSLACLQLYRQGFIEPANPAERPYDIFAHQTLALVKQHSGVSFPNLKDELAANYAFSNIPIADYPDIIKEMLQAERLELINNELIVGIEGERTVNSRDFYSMFQIEPAFKVYHQGRAIGEIPLSALVKEDENILLAAKIWKIKEIDYSAKKIAVMPAHDGKKPQFFGSGGDIHPRVRQEMLEILCNNESYPELDATASEALRQLRNEFKLYPIINIERDRFVVNKVSEIILYTFQGTRINQALQFVLKLLGIDSSYVEHDSSFHLKLGGDQLQPRLEAAKAKIPLAASELEKLLEGNPEMISSSKWGHLLPKKYQAEVLRQKYYDFEGLAKFLEDIKFVFAEELL